MGTLTAKGVPYPVDADSPDVPRDMEAMAVWVDTRPGTQVLTTAQRDALAGGDLWTGRVIYNSTTGMLEAATTLGWKPVSGKLLNLTSTERDALGSKFFGEAIWNVSKLRAEWWDGNRWQDVGYMPNLTTTARDALSATAKYPGQIIWNTTNGVHERWDGTTWGKIAGGGSGAGGAGGMVAMTGTFSTAAVGGVDTTVASVTFSAQAGRRYEVAGWMTATKDATANGVNVSIKDGATTVGYPAYLPSANQYFTMPLSAAFATGTTARQVTINVSVQSLGGNVSPARGLLMVLDVGEDGQVATPSGIASPGVWNSAWGAVAQSITAVGTGQTATSLQASGAATFTPVVGRRYRVFGSCMVTATDVGSIIALSLKEGSTDRNRRQIAASVAGYGQGLDVDHVFDAISATAQTWTMWINKLLGAGTVAAFADGTGLIQLIIEDVGPVSITAPDNWPPPGNRNGGRWRRVATQSLTSGAQAPITWDTEDEDTGAYATPPFSTLTIPAGRDGVYVITADVYVGSPGEVQITAGGQSAFIPSSTRTGHGAVTVTVPLVSGNTVTVYGWQNTGAAVSAYGLLNLYRTGP